MQFYGENIKNNVEELKEASITFQNPFLSLESEEIVCKRLVEVIGKENQIPEKEIVLAVHKAWKELTGLSK